VRKILYCLSYNSRSFCSGYFGNRSLTFYTGQPGQQSFYFKLLTMTGMTDMGHHTQLFSVEVGVSQPFWWGSWWPGTVTLPISAFQVAGIIGMSQ
jgi:hypothetical protein